MIGKRVILCTRSDADLQRFTGRTGTVVSFVDKSGRWRVHCDKISHLHVFEELKMGYLCDQRGEELDVLAAHLALLTPSLVAADSTDSADLAAAVAQLKLDEPNLTARDVHHRLTTDATWSTTQLSDVKRVCSKLAKTGGCAAGLRLAPTAARDEGIRIAMIVAVVDGNSTVLQELLPLGAVAYKNDRNANSVLAFFSAAGQYSQSAECLRVLLAHFPLGSHVFGRWPIAEIVASTATVAGENGSADQLHDLIEHGHDLGAWSGRFLHADTVSPLEATWGRAAGGAFALMSNYRTDDISHAACDGKLSRFVDCLTVLFDAGLQPTASLLNERFLPNCPVETNSKSPYGRTLLQTACGHGEGDLVEQLLGFGADLELVNETPGAKKLFYCGRTALGIASGYGHVRCVKLLLKAGASVFSSSFQARDPTGMPLLYKTPLHAACDFFYSGRKKIVGLLVAANAPLDITYTGRTPLISVCCRDFAGVDNRMAADAFEDAAACASIMLEAGASPDLRVTDGCLHATQTALMAAAQCGMAGCIRALIRHKASLDLVDDAGCTAFAQAVAVGGVEATMLLSAAGADRLILPPNCVSDGALPDDVASVMPLWADLIKATAFRVTTSELEARMLCEVMICLVARGPEPLKSSSSGLLLSLSNVFLLTNTDDALMALERYDGGKCTMAASSDNVSIIIQGLEARGDTKVVCVDDMFSLLPLPTLPLRSVHQVFLLSFEHDNDSSEDHHPLGTLFVPSSATKRDRTLQHEFDDVLSFFMQGRQPADAVRVGSNGDAVRFGSNAGDGVAAALALLGGITIEIATQLEPCYASVPLQTMPSTSVERRCSYCAATQEADGTLVKLKSCARCGQVWYCSSECQRAHWKTAHKRTCTQI